MAFIRRFYIFILFYVRNVFGRLKIENRVSKEDQFARSTADFDEIELTHLARYLTPLECLRLIEKSYRKVPPNAQNTEDDSRKFIKGVHSREWTTENECLLNLEEWNKKYPGIRSPGARLVLESELRSLGRPELANYLKRNGRVVEFLSGFVEHEDEGEQNDREHLLLRRRTFEAKKKKRKMHQMVSNKDTQKSVAIKKEDERNVNSNQNNQCLTILTALGVVVIILCGAVIFLYYRKHRKKPFGLRFGRNERDQNSKRKCMENCGYPDAAGYRTCPCVNLDIEDRWITDEGKYFGRCKSNSESEKLPTTMEITSICTNKPKKRKKKQRKTLRSSEDRKKKDKKRDRNNKNRSRRYREASQQTDLRKNQENVIRILKQDCPNCKCCECCAINGEREKCGKKKFHDPKTNLCHDSGCIIHVAKKIANISSRVKGKSNKYERMYRDEDNQKIMKKSKDKLVAVCTEKTCSRRRARKERKADNK